MNTLVKGFLVFWLLIFPFLPFTVMAFTEPLTYSQANIVSGEVTVTSRWLFVGAVVETLWLMLVFPRLIHEPEEEAEKK